MNHRRWNPTVIETPPGYGPRGGVDFRGSAILAIQKASSIPKAQRDALLAIAWMEDNNSEPQGTVAMVAECAGLKVDRFLTAVAGLIENEFIASVIMEPRPSSTEPWVRWVWGRRIQENRRQF
jgi:hypothetical protein